MNRAERDAMTMSPASAKGASPSGGDTIDRHDHRHPATANPGDRLVKGVHVDVNQVGIRCRPASQILSGTEASACTGDDQRAYLAVGLDLPECRLHLAHHVEGQCIQGFRAVQCQGRDSGAGLEEDVLVAAHCPHADRRKPGSCP